MSDDIKPEYKDLIDRTNFRNGFAMHIGIKATDVDDGYCRAELKVEPHHINPLGSVHGGCLYALADTAGGIAARTKGAGGPTASGSMNFLRSTRNADKLIAEAHVIKSGRSITVSEISIYANDQEVARGLFEFSSFKVPLQENQ